MADKFDRLALRYMIETLVAAALFVAASFAAQEIGNSVEDPQLHVLLALMAMIPMGLVLWAQVRYYRKVDERERQVVATGGAITLLLAVFCSIFLAKIEPYWSVDLNNFGAFLMTAWAVITTAVRRFS